MKPLQTIILAAGRGVRMKSDTPKVLHPVCGKPIVQYVVDVARSLRSLKIYVVLGFKNEVVRRSLSQDLQVVIQKKLLGTADAVRCVQPFLKKFIDLCTINDKKIKKGAKVEILTASSSNKEKVSKGDVLILSGDTPLLTVETVRRVIQRHQSTGAACTFLTTDVDCPYGYGRIIRDQDDQVIAIREEKDASPLEKEISEINVGVYCFEAKILFEFLKAVKLNRKKKEFYLTDVIDLLAQKNAKIETIKTADKREGLGVNTREDLSLAESLIRTKILRRFILNGVTIVDPQTTYINEDVKIGTDTVIRPFTVIEQNVRIGRRCKIGPFCHLRPGTRIADGVEVGNFTEVSRTEIGEGSLMKHFGFLGDAKLGRGVNIGAGTVTANFDGKNKNTTTILDGAFIGSDSILVAPVKIGKKAATGAGCVVAGGHNVPDGRVAVGIPARVIARRKF